MASPRSSPPWNSRPRTVASALFALDNRKKWLKEQAEKRATAEKKATEEQQARINAANAEKEKAKKALLQVSGK